MSQIVHFGNDSLSYLSEFLKDKSPERILLVTGKKSFDICGAKLELDQILKKYHYVRFYDFEENPKIEDVRDGVQIFRDMNCDLIIAVGGGSVIDMGKLINFFNSKEEPFRECLNEELKIEETVPLVAIPTTAGTGSEATHFAVVYVGNDKYSISDKLLLPNYSFILSKLHLSQSSYQKSVSGVDALAQAIESYWSLSSTKESRNYSLDALRLIIPNLYIVVKKSNVKAHENLAMGAYLAGKAINIAKTTAPHAFSYYLTKRFGLPHGHAVAIFLSSFVKYNTFLNSDIKNRNKTKELNKLIKLLKELLPGSDKSQIDQRVDNYIKSLGINLELDSLNISKKEILIALKSGNIERLKNNPRKFDLNEFIKESYII